MPDLYNKYFVENNFERSDLWSLFRKKYKIHSALYPGSFLHVSPSFYFPRVVYVDTDRQAKKFFADQSSVRQLINTKKKYEEEPKFDFIKQDYNIPLNLEEESFDLLISQYAGIISQPCKKYLRIGGILLANNSHGDAGVANLDKDYQLIAVVTKSGGKHKISEKDLDQYFIPKKNINPDMDELINLGKGMGYTKTASGYLFERLK